MTKGRSGLGCIVVFAAGNYGIINYPGNFHDDILCVGAIDMHAKRAVFSSTFGNDGSSAFGDQLDIVAPGYNIYSTLPYNKVGSQRGTSMAAPHGVGVAALMLSINPNLTQKQVVDIIEQTAQKVGGYNYADSSGRANGTWNSEMGYGLVDACAAVASVAGTTCEMNIIHYDVNVCYSPSNEKYGTYNLEVTEEDFEEAEWHVISVHTPKQIGGSSFPLTEYLSDYMYTYWKDMGIVNVYLKLTNGKIYHWNVKIIEVDELISEYYINNPVEGLTVSSNK